MAMRNIVKLGDDVLRKKCRAITMIDKNKNRDIQTIYVERYE